MRRANILLPMRGRWERVPRNAGGDPAFTTLGEILQVFSPEEVVILVNRELYRELYAREGHARRRARAQAPAPLGKEDTR
jgi:hypothetical protein